jgi:hypothetical protein
MVGLPDRQLGGQVVRLPDRQTKHSSGSRERKRPDTHHHRHLAHGNRMSAGLRW